MLVNVKIISCLLCSRLCCSGKCILLYVVRRGVQTGCSKADLKDQSTQCGSTQASYQRNEKQENFTSYENLLRDYLWDREFTLSWLREEGLIASSRNCTMCGSEMNWVRRGDRSNGYIWECSRQINGKRHRCERSIREGSWFENSNMTIEKVLKFTYWWCQDLNQWQIKQQLGLGSHTVVDWDMFCREVCEVALFDGRKLAVQGNWFRLMKAKLERESTIVDM